MSVEVLEELVAELERKMEVEKALVIEILKDSQKGNKLMEDKK